MESKKRRNLLTAFSVPLPFPPHIAFFFLFSSFFLPYPRGGAHCALGESENEGVVNKLEASVDGTIICVWTYGLWRYVVPTVETRRIGVRTAKHEEGRLLSSSFADICCMAEAAHVSKLTDSNDCTRLEIPGEHAVMLIGVDTRQALCSANLNREGTVTTSERRCIEAAPPSLAFITDTHGRCGATLQLQPTPRWTFALALVARLLGFPV